jgi:hypothetical protein
VNILHKISISAANPQNTTAIKDYKAIQKHMKQIDKSIDGCDIKKDFITSSIDATKLLQGLHMVDRNNRTNESHRLHVLLLSTTSRAGAKLIVAQLSIIIFLSSFSILLMYSYKSGYIFFPI